MESKITIKNSGFFDSRIQLYMWMMIHPEECGGLL